MIFEVFSNLKDSIIMKQPAAEYQSFALHCSYLYSYTTDCTAWRIFVLHRNTLPPSCLGSTAITDQSESSQLPSQYKVGHNSGEGGDPASLYPPYEEPLLENQPFVYLY